MPEDVARHRRLALGLISGTSMDGVDAGLVRLSGPPHKPRVRLLEFLTLAYPRSVRGRLLEVAGCKPTCACEISQLNFLLGELFAEAALRVCRRSRISPKRLAVIGSHGQTVYHQGSPTLVAGRRIASTFQIAEPAVIAARTGATVVADFRPADVAGGGQGAPLVPIVDYFLFRDAREGTVALNIGGIANVTVIPPRARLEDVFGFDTGPGNMVIDALVRRLTGGRQTYDAGGRLAAQGRVIDPLLQRMLRLPFFRRQAPKSAGREQFGSEFVTRYFLRRQDARFKDLLRTATELTVRSIVEALGRYVFPEARVHRLIVSGGGAHNRLVMARLQELLPRISVHRSDKYGVPVDAKEAISFAVLADLTLHSLPGNLPGVTGARRPVVLGKLVRP